MEGRDHLRSPEFSQMSFSSIFFSTFHVHSALSPDGGSSGGRGRLHNAELLSSSFIGRRKRLPTVTDYSEEESS